MERSLREETIKWLRERERRRRQGESRGMARIDSHAIRSEDRAVSYAEMAEQDSRRRYPTEMDLDDDDYQRPPPRHRDLDPRDPRPVGSGRVSIPVSTGYAPEPGYTAGYAISSSQPGYASGQAPYYGPDREPRSAFNPGNTTPPAAISRTTPGGTYVQPPGYISRTAPPVSSSIPASYGDPRRDMMGGHPSGYAERRK